MDLLRKQIGVWLPAVRTNTGTDIFTERLSSALSEHGIRNHITWLPHKAEYLPWLCDVPEPPEWATVVHINSWLHKRFVPRNMPVIATFHSVPQDKAMAPYRTVVRKLYHKLWVNSLEQANYLRADFLTAVSRHVADTTRNIYGCREVITIYNWVDTDIFKKQTVDKLPGKKLLFLGTLSIRKGADLLVDIMNELGADYTLFFTGADNKVPGHRQIPDNMVSIGRVSGNRNLARLYNDIDLLLFPTRSEGFGLVAIEAQACGLPVVSTDIPPLTEVVLRDQTGKLCPPDHPQAYAEAVRLILEDPSRYAQMQARCLEHANSFSKTRIIKKYIDLYEKADAQL